MTHPTKWIALLSAGIVTIALPLSALAAQQASGSPVPKLFGSFKPVLGAWSEYSVTETPGDKVTKMRMSIVGQEGPSYWYEVNQDDGENRNIIKMLVTGNPHDPDNIQRLIMKSGDNPAQEMPADFVAMGRKMAVHMFESRSGIPAGTEVSELKVEEMGLHKVEVPAGTFEASLRKVVDADGKVLSTAYFDGEIPPFGVISSKTDRSHMKLLAYGGDAKSAITETPVPMSAPPGMPKGMPRGIPPGLQGTMGK